MGDIGDILTDTYTFDDLFPDRSRQSTKRGRASHQRGGVLARGNIVPMGGNDPYTRGRRGEEFGTTPQMRASASRKVKARNEFSSYLSNGRAVRSFNERADGNGIIRFRNREEMSYYQNQRGLTNSYEENQRGCDNGDANACSNVGRVVGDNANPITNPNASEALFGFQNAPGYTRDDITTLVQTDGSQRTSGVDNVPAGGGMIQPRPDTQEATIPQENPQPEVIRPAPQDIVVPDKPKNIFVSGGGRHHDSHEDKHGSHTGGDVPTQPSQGQDGSTSIVREEVVDLNQHDISSAGRGETQNEVKRYLENLKATTNPFLDPYKQQCFTYSFYSDNVRIH